MICNLPLSCGLCQVLVCDYAKFIKQVETTLFLTLLNVYERLELFFSLECLIELTDKTSGPGVFFIRSLLTILQISLVILELFSVSISS